MFKKIAFISVLLFSMVSSAHAGVWNGMGTISDMWIYPEYAVVIQGGTDTVNSDCTSTSWSFYWADFSPEAQSRIMGMLLTARTANTSFQVAIDGSECGPEGKKKFNGQFHF